MSKTFVALLIAFFVAPTLATGAESDDYGFPVEDQRSSVSAMRSSETPVTMRCAPIIYSSNQMIYGYPVGQMVPLQ
jgi:hypothetical protein